MIFLYVNNSERSSDIEDKTIARSNQIQQRADDLSFRIFQNAKPSENQDVRFFLGDTVASAAGAVITLNGNFERNVARFYAGQVLYIRIGDADEEKCTVLSYDESTLTLTLTAAPSGSVVSGDKIGELAFGGVVSRVDDENIAVLQNIEYDTTCVDYTKIFDKKIVADTWENVDGRYIINDFVNSTVNYNATLDNMSYADNSSIQAEWIESGTGSNPTVDTSDYLEGTASGVLAWIGAGTAIFSATPSSTSLVDLVGAATGTPTKGAGMLWVQPTDYTVITSIKLRIGSDSSNYAEITLPSLTANAWKYGHKNLTTATIVGTPNWAAVDYIAIVVAHSATGSMKVNGFRVNADKSFTLYSVESTPVFTDFRSPQLKPTSLMQIIAKSWEYIWYIDYERDIHYVDSESMSAPFSLTDTSANFSDLKIGIDESQIGNRVIVRGGEKTSSSIYAQVIPGDNSKREWVLKNKFNNMVVRIDDNTLTNAAEVGTNTTNIKITAHGFVTGDHVINRTRSNAVREITVVDANNFTVASVSSQTNGDTISHFKPAETIGVEGIADETTVTYVHNSNAQSVRATPTTVTLTTAHFIRFSYNERVPIQIQYTDNASANALKALGLGDGIFDLDPITDRNIEDTNTAITLAQAKVRDFANPIIKGTFRTDINGLRAGQQLQVQDTVRNINTSYLIQAVKMKQRAGEFKDYFIYDVTFGTTLFGIIEFYQKLLATKDAIEANVDDIVDTYVTADEVVESSDANSVTTDGGFLTASQAEEVTSDDVNVVVDFTAGTWRYEPNGVGQPLESRFDLADYG